MRAAALAARGACLGWGGFDGMPATHAVLDATLADPETLLGAHNVVALF